jgi:hypothetical protein
LDAALSGVRAILNVARSTGDEGLDTTGLVRNAIRSIAVGQIERVLAQGQPGADALAATQRLVELELAEPLLATLVRGERAYFDFLIEQWETGSLSNEDMGLLFEDVAGKFQGGPQKTTPTGNEALDKWLHHYFAIDWGRHDFADILRYHTRLAVAAAQPPDTRSSAWNEDEKGRAELRPGVRNAAIVDVWQFVIESHQRCEAQLAAAATALAAERFRQDQGRWPASLRELVPAYLSEVPIDLFDGQRLRLKRVDDGLVIYSVGKDGEDNGGDVHPQLDQMKWQPDDVGLKLWDADKRRQPAPPKRPKPPPFDADGDPPSNVPPPGKPSGG